MRKKINLDGVWRRFAVFSGIGLLNTFIHTLSVILFIEFFGFDSVLSNGIAFVIANLFSYWANGRWSFRAHLSMRQYGRFLVVSSLGLVVTLLVSSFASWIGWHYMFGLALVFVVLPIFSFLLHFLWTFKV